MRGKRVLVTGASGGVGAATCVALAREGAALIGTYLRGERRAAELQLQLGSRTRMVRADLATRGGREMVLEACEDGLDGVVLAAGVARHGPFVEQPEDTDGDRRDPLIMQLRTNLEAPLLLLRGLLSRSLLAEGASVVVVGSNLAHLGVAGTVGYAAAKAGIEGAVRALAAEFGPSGIRVNAVAPGLLLTEMTRERNHDELAAIARGTPLRRLGEAADVVGPILFLLSADAGFVTGQVLCVDGGASMAGT